MQRALSKTALTKTLRKMKVIIVTHVSATGPAHDLEKYLKDKVDLLLFIGHPFQFSHDTRSHMRIWSKSRLEESYMPNLRIPEILSYVKDVLVTFIFIMLTRKKYDLYVGADCLNASLGVILRKLGLVRSVVFYTIDFVPQRFDNKLMNKLYHVVESFATKNSDIVWNLSPRIEEARKQKGLDPRYCAPQITVPIGVHTERVKIESPKNIHRFSVVYMGHLLEKQGVMIIADAIPLVLAKVPQAHFIFIGKGPCLSALEESVKKAGVEKSVEFLGYIEDHRKLERVLSKCAVGLAPYPDTPDNYTRYTDPGKPKVYMACGLPVIITKVPAVAEEIEREKAGIVVRDDSKEIADAIVRLLTDDKLFLRCRKNSIKLARNYSWDTIFTNALVQTLCLLNHNKLTKTKACL